MVQGEKKGATIDLDEELIIGRGEKCRLILDDTYVSTVHARIFAKGDTYMLEDLGSTNGTYVNGRRINPHVEESLNHGDILALGKLKIQVLLRNI